MTGPCGFSPGLLGGWPLWILTFSIFACIQPVHGGVAEDCRQRNIFPLPELPHDEGCHRSGSAGEMSVCRRQQMAGTLGISTINGCSIPPQEDQQDTERLGLDCT